MHRRNTISIFFKPLIFVLAFCSTLSILGQNMNISNGNVFDGEPYLAVNPNDSEHIVIAWMSWINITNQFQIKTSTSFNAGLTWSIPALLPHIESNYSSADPCLDFNKNGDVFLSYIDFTGTTPPVTGGVYLAKSEDGGLSWAPANEVIHSTFDGDKWPLDRPWMVIDPSSSGDSTVIYITTFNLNRTLPSFNPYLSVSDNGGQSFQSNILDTQGWRAGNFNPFPMCSPAVNEEGTFFGIYPSFAPIQSPSFNLLFVKSSDQGVILEHNLALTQDFPPNVTDYPFAKKGSLLLSDPSDNDHLALILLGADFGNLDVFFSESYDAGLTWSSPIKINDDPINNDRMQDLIWGDYDNDGDLVVSWRDRRNASNNSFQSSSEIWASYKLKDSSNFSSNFPITNESVLFDPVLERSGNDFMTIKLQEDVLYATWGDTRSGQLNIWFQSMTIGGQIISSQQVSPFQQINVEIYPNPAQDRLTINGEDIKTISVYNTNGKLIEKLTIGSKQESVELNTKNFLPGPYFLQINTKKGIITKQFIIG